MTSSTAATTPVTTTNRNHDDVRAHLVPKRETHVTSFLRAHPAYDGRGVLVGVLDTGVDPGTDLAAEDDRLVDVVDCTGSGDVDVSTETTAKLVRDDDGDGDASYYEVTGLSGRTLRLNKDWTYRPFPNKNKHNNKDNSKDNVQDTSSASASASSSSSRVPVRLGLKRAYELFPSRLRSRVATERRRRWEAVTARYAAAARVALQRQQAMTSARENDEDDDEIKTTTATRSSSSARDEYQARLDILQDKRWIDEDPGPLLDCVVFYDGTVYRAVVASSEQGDTLDLTRHEPLTSYGTERRYGTVGTVDQLNYAVQFYGDDGTVLSLAADASPHGTHVTGITAGVAPGARVVSLQIGDHRLGSMETGTALTRACVEAVRRNCHVVNLSYGEGTAVPDHGRFVALAADVVCRYGITFVSSAGNNGPALSTVGAPGGTSAPMLGIAAYVSPVMQRILYSLPVQQNNDCDGDDDDDCEDISSGFHDNTNGNNKNDNVDNTTTDIMPPNRYGDERHWGGTYTWSSVGPTADGDWGVNLTAPGGAITAVSNWCLQKSQLMNGTSMSSPHATGCVALLQSACLANSMSTSPNLLRTALMNTAQNLSHLNVCQQGAGMIHVSAAWEYLQRYHDVLPDVHYRVTIDNLVGAPRGVYLRQPHETNVAQTLTVTIDPQWPRQDVTTAAAQKRKIAYEAQFTLVSTAPTWVKTPSNFMLMNNGRSFKMDVDPSELPPGLHTAQVLGMDAQHPEAGPLFRVPVTVTKATPLPEHSNTLDLGELSFEPSEIKRFFVVPPLGATWMDVVLTDTRQPSKEAYTKIYALHTVQLLPHAAYRDFEMAKFFNMRPAQTTVTSIAVEAGVTAEIDVGRYWSTLGGASLQVQVHFRGIRPVPNHVQMMCGDAGSLVRVVSDLADESVLPVAKLTKWSTPLRPLEKPLLQPLGPRDVLPSHEREIYQLVLTYEFTQEEKGSFTPRVPTTQGVLYESGLESQLIMIYDGDKKLLGCADSWPSSVSAPKGKVVLRMQIRHDNPEKLEALKETPLWIERNIDKEISLSVFGSQEAMIMGKSNFKKLTLRKGCTAAVFFQEPAVSKLPSACKAGDVLKGHFTIASGEASLIGEGKRPKGFPIIYTVGPKPAKASDPEPPEPKDDRSVSEKLHDAIRDLKVTKLDELTSKEKEEGKFDVLYDEFVREYPKHLPLLMAKLRHLDGHTKRKDKLTGIIASAEAVLAEIDEDALAMFFGRRSDPDDPQAIKLKKEMKEKKSFLVEALARSAMAHAEIATEDSGTQFHALLSRLKAWMEIESDKQYLHLYLEREKRAERYGMVVKAINKVLAKEIKDKDFLYPTTKSKLMEERAAALDKLGYKELVDRDRKMRVVACPRSYALF